MKTEVETQQPFEVSDPPDIRNVRQILLAARGLIAAEEYSVRDAIYAIAPNGEADAAAMKALRDAGVPTVSTVMPIAEVLVLFDNAIANEKSHSVIRASTISSPLTAEEAKASRVTEARERIARGVRVFRPDIVGDLCDEIERLRSELIAVTTAGRSDSLMDHNTFPANDSRAAVATVPSVAMEQIVNDILELLNSPNNYSRLQIATSIAAYFRAAPSTPSSSAEIAQSKNYNQGLLDSLGIIQNHRGRWLKAASYEQVELIVKEIVALIGAAELAVTPTGTESHDDKYFEVIGESGVISLCSGDQETLLHEMYQLGTSHVLAFGEISEEDFNRYGDDDWTEPISTVRWRPTVETLVRLSPLPSLPESREP